MDRFLADCAQELQLTNSKDKNLLSDIDSVSDHNASREIQEIFNQSSTLDLQSLTLEDVLGSLKDSNPFREDVLQEISVFNQVDKRREHNAFKVFESAQKDENIPDEVVSVFSSGLNWSSDDGE